MKIIDSKAAQSLTAHIILKKGKFIAKVLAHYSDSGVVNVEVFENWNLTHTGKAGGYGYDKYTAALRGAVIDGVKIMDNCGVDETSDKLFKQYRKLAESGKDTKGIEAKVRKIGASFANYQQYIFYNEKWSAAYNVPYEVDKKSLPSRWIYCNVYYSAGLDRLRNLGYNVIQII